MLRLTTLAIIVTLALGCSALTTNVMTSNGPVVGVQEDSYFTWKGIPYAKAHRWSPPGPPQAWSSPISTTNFGPCCPQMVTPYFELEGVTSNVTVDEECLSLNVWSPVGAQGLPVLIYIHGGGYVSGCSNRDRYHGSFMAGATPTVVVTINYRLGVFGFLASNELTGNYGIMDQEYAMAWVQKNIASFGGDPRRVTIDGQSAGGISIATHLSLPSSPRNQYFRAAIIQSDPVLIQFRTTAEQQPQYDAIATALGCGFAASKLDCMKQLPWQTLLNAQSWGAAPLVLHNSWKDVIHKLIWSPTIDGTYITQTPSTAFQSGNFYKVPVLIGTVSNETAGFLPLALGDGPGTPFLAAAFYQYGFDTLFGLSLAAKVRALYSSTRTDSEDAISRALTDFAFICPVLQSANWLSQYVNTYVYQFSHSPSCDPNNFRSSICNNRVCHSAEVDFVFHSISLDRRGSCTWTNDEQNLSWDMLYAWTNFTASPSSTASGVPRWTGKNVYQFDIPSFTSTDRADNANCAFWAGVVAGTIN